MSLQVHIHRVCHVSWTVQNGQTWTPERVLSSFFLVFSDHLRYILFRNGYWSHGSGASTCIETIPSPNNKFYCQLGRGGLATTWFQHLILHTVPLRFIWLIAYLKLSDMLPFGKSQVTTHSRSKYNLTEVSPYLDSFSVLALVVVFSSVV